MPQSRRQFLLTLLAGAITAPLLDLRTAQAAKVRRSRRRLKVLTLPQAQTLDALGEVLLPGARDAGLVRFVDSQLSLSPERQVMMIRYLGVPPPFAGFYQSGLDALDQASRQRQSRAFADLDATAAAALVAQLATGKVEGWQGPPPGFFHFVLRNDAVDVVYGTKAGFARLGVPYMAHIEPTQDWPE